MDVGLEKSLIAKPRFSRVLVLCYASIFVLSNWIDFRYVKTLDLMTIVGVFPLIVSFLLLDIIIEVYGYKLARCAIWYGVLFSVILLIFSQFFTNFTSTDFNTSADFNMFDGVFLKKTTLIFASILAAFTSQSLNSYIMATLKIKMKGENFVTRLSVSTILSTGVDSIVVLFIIFYNLISIHQLVAKILSLWFFKLASVFISLPVIVKLCVKIKSIEKLDIYDKNTDFNPFKFETRYTTSDNQYFVDSK